MSATSESPGVHLVALEHELSRACEAAWSDLDRLAASRGETV